MRRRLLYLTADGLLEPLGFSQVLRVVEGLAKRGWRYSIFSLEKPSDLARADRVAALRSRLAEVGVGWSYATYAVGGGARAAVANQSALVSAALARAARGQVDGIHARAYHGAFAALAANLTYGVPYLFDTRAYWFDERLEEGRWFTTPVRLGVARGVEHLLYSRAAAIVTLTELHADDVRSGKFGPPGQRAIKCIPTCADFDQFRRRALDECTSVPEALRAALHGKRVLGIVGSINRSYLVDETLQLAKYVLEGAGDVHLLILSGQRTEYERRANAAGLPMGRVHIHAADHETMPEWLSMMDWGCLLLQPASAAKRASMPTKLAEFFACGVRPVQYGCNEEVSKWVGELHGGLVLPGVTPAHLRTAAEGLLGATESNRPARGTSPMILHHFSLHRALGGYERLLEALVGPTPCPFANAGQS